MESTPLVKDEDTLGGEGECLERSSSPPSSSPYPQQPPPPYNPNMPPYQASPSQQAPSPQIPHQSQLTIIGAAYGLGCVTHKTRSLQGNSSHLVVTANNATFGDTWHNVRKSLVVIYQYEGYPPEVAIAQEGQKLCISPPGYIAELTIIGATYGLGCVTDKTRTILGSSKHLVVTANNATFGDTWHGVKKSLTVVYQYEGHPTAVAIAQEGQKLCISPPRHASVRGYERPSKFCVIGAAYGLADVTVKANSQISNDKLKICANNRTFSDSWRGIVKSFVAVFDNGDGQPYMVIVSEGRHVSVSAQ